MSADLDRKIRDPKFFIERFFWIVDKNQAEVPFRFNPIQKRYYAERTHNDLILKARKEGLSSLILALWLHACLFQRNTRAVVVSHEAESTKRLFSRVKFYLSSMGLKDRKFDFQLNDDSQNHISFQDTNSSFWIGTAGSKSFGRGDDITHLHLSEVAHYQDQTILTGVLEACMPSAWRVMETTANGTGEVFEKLWRRAKNEEPGVPWKPHFYAWFDDPSLTAAVPQGYIFSAEDEKLKAKYKVSNPQVYWYRLKEAEMVDKNLLPQEYPSDDVEAFVSSGVGAFDKAGLAEQDKMMREPVWTGYLRDDVRGVEFLADPHGSLSIWKQPQSGSQYFIAADVAKGVEGGDFSIGLVIDRSNWEVVAKFKDRIEVLEFGRKLYGLGLYYNTAKIAVEVWPGPGLAANAELVKIGYPTESLYHRLKWDGEKHTSRPEVGWVTDERGRYDLITSLQGAISHRRILIRDREALEECRSFQRNIRGRYEARSGTHDDHVIALGIACFCMTHDPVQDMLAGSHVAASVIGSAVNGGSERHYGKLWRARQQNGR